MASRKFEGGHCFGNVRQVAPSMTSQPLGTLGQALNCRLARGVGEVRFFYHALAAQSQVCEKSLWVRACYNYYLRLSSATVEAFDRLALLGDWQAFHQPPWASLSATGGRGGGVELIAVICQSSGYVLLNQARHIGRIFHPHTQSYF